MFSLFNLLFDHCNGFFNRIISGIYDKRLIIIEIGKLFLHRFH